MTRFSVSGPQAKVTLHNERVQLADAAVTIRAGHGSRQTSLQLKQTLDRSEKIARR
jgi:hypothetical protein